MQAEYKINMSRGVLLLEKGEQSGIPEYVEKMLIYNKLNGFLCMSIEETDNKKRYEYDITGMKGLQEYCEKCRFSEAMIRALIGGILMAVEECEGFLLPESSIVLDPEYIFIENPEEELPKPRLCCYPDYNGRLRAELYKLLSMLINYVEYNDKGGVMLLYSLHRRAGEETCTIKQLKDMLIKKHEEKKDIKEADAPPIVYRKQSRPQRIENQGGFASFKNVLKRLRQDFSQTKDLRETAGVCESSDYSAEYFEVEEIPFFEKNDDK